MTLDLRRFALLTRRQFCSGTLGAVAAGALCVAGRTAEDPQGESASLTLPSVWRAGQFDRPWGVLALTLDLSSGAPVLDHGWHTGKRRLRCRWRGAKAALWVSIPAGLPPDEVSLTAINNSNAPLRLHCTALWRIRSAAFPASDATGWTPIPPGGEVPLRYRIATESLNQMDGLQFSLESAGDSGDVLLSELELHTAARELGSLRMAGPVRAGRPAVVQIISAIDESLWLEVRRGDIAVWAQRLPECPASQQVSHQVVLPAELTAGTYVFGLTSAGRRNVSGDVSVRVETGVSGTAFTGRPVTLRAIRCDLAQAQGSDVTSLLDRLESEAISHDPTAGLQIRVMMRPPLWWVLANRRDVALHADGWFFSPAVDSDGYPMASLASDVWRMQSVSLLQALVDGIKGRRWGQRVVDICLELPTPPPHKRAADYSTNASARLAGWLAETRRMAPSRVNLVPLPERLDPVGVGIFASDERDVQAYSWRLFHDSLTIEYTKQLMGALSARSAVTITVGVPEWPSLWYPYPARWFDAGVQRVERRSALLMTGGDASRHPWPVQVALVCDEASMRLTPPGSPYGYAGAVHLAETLNRIGAPWSARTADQLTSLSDEVKLLILFGFIAPDSSMRRVLQQVIRQGGRHVVVFGPAGLVDPVTREWRRSGPRLLLSLPLEFDHGPGPIEIGAGPSAPIWPRIIGDDTGGLLYSDGTPATSHRESGRGLLTWCGSPYLDSGILRDWGTAAGIHLYAPEGVSIGFSESSMTVLSRDTSDVLLQLPAPRTLRDPLDGWTAAGSRIVCPVVPNRLRRLEVLEA